MVGVYAWSTDGWQKAGISMKRIALLLCCGVLIAPLKAQTATDVIRKADEKLRGQSSCANVTIRIVRPSWNRDITTTSWSLGSDYALIYISDPARDAGTVFLKRNKEIWNWQPAIERTIKLPPSMMMQSWMGSDFTNDDLVRESSIVNDYTHEFDGDTIIQGYDCYKIVLTPKPDAAVVWGKIISYISRNGSLQLMAKFYDEDGYLINQMQGFDITEFDGRTLPGRVRMTPMETPEQYTEMVYRGLKFDIDVTQEFFSQRNMKRIRP